MELLNAYFRRIDYDGARTPDLATLLALHELHPAAIPFEALDVLLGRPISLAPEDVDAKLITAGRGGYCFEQNSLFQRVLQALGYEVEALIAQVRWMAGPEAQERARTHMVLRVTLDGERWLCDVGFGGCVLTAPLRFDTPAAQQTPHERFRLTPVPGGEHLLEMEMDGDWQQVYQISPALCRSGDYEMANFYTSQFPSSHFRHNLIVARTTPQARYALLQNRLTVRRRDGAAERRYLSQAELRLALEQQFLLPVDADWEPLLAEAARDGGGGA